MDLAGSICDDAVCQAFWFALLTGPFILVAAITITLVARQVARAHGKVVSGWVWVMTFFGLVVILIPVAYVVLELRERSKLVGHYEEAVRSINYQTYWPAEHPEGFEVSEVTAAGYPPVAAVTITYDTPMGDMQASQSPTLGGEDHLDPEDCKPDVPGDLRFGGPLCRLLVTPEGNEVVITRSPQGCVAAVVINTTRLTIDCLALDGDSVARYFDSMEPIDAMDIGFSHPRDFL